MTREFRISRAKLSHGALLAAILAVIGLWVFFAAGPALPDGRLIGGVNLALAAAVAFHVLRNARDPRPRMVLDEDGIWFHDWGLPPVPWRCVGDIYPRGGRLQSFVCIELRDAEELLGTAGGNTRPRSNRRLVRPPLLLVPNGALDAPLDEILSAIREARARASGG